MYNVHYTLYPCTVKCLLLPTRTLRGIPRREMRFGVLLFYTGVVHIANNNATFFLSDVKLVYDRVDRLLGWSVMISQRREALLPYAFIGALVN